MDIRGLGIPIYTDEDDREYVDKVDLKLALDRDKYERIADKVAGEKVYLDWLKHQH